MRRNSISICSQTFSAFELADSKYHACKYGGTFIRNFAFHQSFLFLFLIFLILFLFFLLLFYLNSLMDVCYFSMQNHWKRKRERVSERTTRKLVKSLRWKVYPKSNQHSFKQSVKVDEGSHPPLSTNNQRENAKDSSFS